MDYNSKLFEFYDYIKEKGLISTYVDLAAILSTNKAGINDLKNGKKKLSIDNIKSMKKSYPILNVDWFLSDDENMTIDYTKSEENVPHLKGNIKGNTKGNNPNVQKMLPFKEKAPIAEMVAEERTGYGSSLKEIDMLKERLQEQKELYTGQIQFLTSQIETLTKDKDERIQEYRDRIRELKGYIETLKNVSPLDDSQEGVG